MRRGRPATANLKEAPRPPARAAAGVIKSMMWRYDQQRQALDGIEKPLVASDPRLASMFAIFTSMTQHEPMPVTERVTPRLSRLLRKASLILGLFLFTPMFSARIWAV